VISVSQKQSQTHPARSSGSNGRVLLMKIE
jgi:hypothetical protein